MGNSFTKTKAATGLAVVALAVGGLLVFRAQQNPDQNSSNLPRQQLDKIPPQPQQPPKPQQTTIVPVVEQSHVSKISHEDRLKIIANGVKVDIEQDGNIHIETLVQILERSPELVIEQYKQLTMQNRQQRRAVRKSNPLEYQDLALQYNDEVEKILEDAQLQLLEKLDIPKELFEQSIVHFMQKGFVQNFMMLQGSIRQQIKTRESLKPTQVVSWQQTKDILRSQVDIIQREQATFQDALRNLAEQSQNDPEKAQLIPAVIHVMIADFIHEQHGIEDEDIVPMLSNPSMLTDPEVQKSLMQIEQQMMVLMQSLQMLPGMGMGMENDMEQMLNGMGMDQMGQY